MDLDDLFDRDRDRDRDPDRRSHRPHRRRDGAGRHRERSRDRDRHRDDRPRGWRRRAHPHLFSWLVVAGGVVIVALLLLAIAAASGVGGHVADAYFAAGRAVLPASWQDGWLALPGVAHVAIVLGAVFVVAGLAGELLD